MRNYRALRLKPRALRACLALAGVLAWLSWQVAATGASNEPSVAEVRVAAVGDIMLGGTAEQELVRFGYDYPFERVRDVLRGAQLVVGNLEGPLTDNGEPAGGKQYLFRSPPDKVAPALARAGFRVLSLANNHTMDYGRAGLDDTTAALARAGIRHTGAGADLKAARRPAIVEAGGMRFAFLSYSLTFPEEFWATAERPGTAFGHEHHVRADISAARTHADIVIVSFHWGREGTTELRDYQTQLGRAAVDAGAAAVIGHHPHVLQAVERYRDGIILYSLGNFVFGSYSPDAVDSAIAIITFRGRRIHDLQLLPINVKNADVVFQPQPLADRAADDVVGRLQALSRALGTTIENRRGVGVLQIGKRD